MATLFAQTEGKAAKMKTRVRIMTNVQKSVRISAAAWDPPMRACVDYSSVSMLIICGMPKGCVCGTALRAWICQSARQFATLHAALGGNITVIFMCAAADECSEVFMAKPHCEAVLRTE